VTTLGRFWGDHRGNGVPANALLNRTYLSLSFAFPPGVNPASFTERAMYVTTSIQKTTFFDDR
jgi:hypothetical protein